MRFGQPGVVLGVDSRREDGDWFVYQYTGDPTKTRATRRRTHRLGAGGAAERGAGEIVLNCMNQDGMRQGYDLEQLAAVRDVVRVPLIASGGAGATEHFRDVFAQARVDGALAASVFRKGRDRDPRSQALSRRAKASWCGCERDRQSRSSTGRRMAASSRRSCRTPRRSAC